MKRQSILTLAGMALAALSIFPGMATKLWAKTVPIYFAVSQLDSSLETELCATALMTTRCDTDTTAVTGDVMVDLEIDFDPVTHQVIDISEIQFTGGLISTTEDLAFELNFGVPGSINAIITDISGTLDTPSPPGLVSAGNFSMIDHVLILNDGWIDGEATGPLGGIMDPFSKALFDEPLESSYGDIGSITASLVHINGDDITYDAYLTLPVVFDMTFYQNDVEFSFAGTGVLDAEGQFTRTIPEPFTLLLLGLGVLVLRGKRS